MAKKTAAKKETSKKEVAPSVKEKKGKKTLTAEEKKARTEARKARLAALPEGQRSNSKTIDVIEGANGTKVTVYAQPIRKFGVIVTSVVTDAKGNIIATSGPNALAGYRVKSKKGHGNLVFGAPGVGKKSKASDEDDDSDDDSED